MIFCSRLCAVYRDHFYVKWKKRFAKGAEARDLEDDEGGNMFANDAKQQQQLARGATMELTIASCLTMMLILMTGWVTAAQVGRRTRAMVTRVGRR